MAERSTRPLTSFDALPELNAYRARLRSLGLLGADANGIGFGNVSIREGAATQFYITGSSTGHKEELFLTDCAKVVACDLARNWLEFEGNAMASSESPTHAAIYEAAGDVGAIIHCHSLKLWSALLDQAPGTPADVEYGTPEMARAVRHLFETTNLRERKVFAMAGHREGVIAFGKHLPDAYAALQGAAQTAELDGAEQPMDEEFR